MLFGPIEQGAIAELRPSAFEGCIYPVPQKVTPKGYGGSLIEENLHRVATSRRARSS